MNTHKVELRVHSARLNSLELLIHHLLCCQRNTGLRRSRSLPEKHGAMLRMCPSPPSRAPCFHLEGRGRLQILLPAGVCVESRPVPAQTVQPGPRAQTSLGPGSRVPLAVPAETGGLLQVLPVCANKSLLSDILKDFQQHLFLKAVPLHLHYYLHISHKSNDQFFKKTLFLNLGFFSDFKMRYKDIRPIFQKPELISLI